MDLDDVRERLVAGLGGPLPGAAGQLLLAPDPRPGWQPGRWPAGCRAAAALVLLYPVGGRAHLLLTVRRPDLVRHGGQVAFPGGAVERGETIERAALREAAEEVALDPALAAIAGRLSPLHVPVSRFVLHPVVALAERRPPLRADGREVSRLLEPSLDMLSQPGAVVVKTELRDAATFRVPAIEIDGERVWGATAMVLGELLSLLGRPPVVGA